MALTILRMILLLAVSYIHCWAAPILEDSNLWLEEVEGKKAIEWVKVHNDATVQAFESHPKFKSIESELRKILLAKDRIPHGSLMGEFVYNFWQDAKYVRGVWRRTSLEEYKKTEPKWEEVLDIDALSKEENENWVWKSAQCLAPQYQRCLLSLSRGGKDAVVVREFDVAAKRFVKGGFELSESKTNISWVDENTVFVGTDFGPGSMTDSGYPRIVKLWQRGTTLAEAKTVFEGKTTDVNVWGATYQRPEGSVSILGRSISFFTGEYFVFNLQTHQKVKINIPEDAEFSGVYQGSFLVTLRSDWKVNGKVFTAGSLVRVVPSRVELLYSPNQRSSIQSVAVTKNEIFLDILENVRGKIVIIKVGPSRKIEQVPLPDQGSTSLLSYDSFGEKLFVSFESFLTPTSVFVIDEKTASSKIELIKQLPKRFDESDLEVEQFYSKSKDGTKIPYFLVHRKKLKLDGSYPTLLYGYGGFEISMTPSYSGGVGKVWLERGGVYALANIRGGGEFGPKWHQAALQKNRQKAYDDFISVAEDLIHRKVTSPEHLGMMGGSNGGLLVGATFVERPDLFNAVVCQVPLLDMLRYNKLLAGASWVGEYGDPADPEIYKAIIKYSPYQNVKAQVKYPRVFFRTSTKDDRVHPGHARKMVARMESQGHSIYYFENIEGGHSAAANLEQRIRMSAFDYTYLSLQLGL